MADLSCSTRAADADRAPAANIVRLPDPVRPIRPTAWEPSADESAMIERLRRAVRIGALARAHPVGLAGAAGEAAENVAGGGARERDVDARVAADLRRFVDAAGRRLTLFRPRATVFSLDERWLLRLLTALGAGDHRGAAGLIAFRVAKPRRRSTLAAAVLLRGALVER